MATYRKPKTSTKIAWPSKITVSGNRRKARRCQKRAGVSSFRILIIESLRLQQSSYLQDLESALQLLQINVANSSIIEFYRRAKKLFVPLFFVVLSFFYSSLIDICSLTNNLPSNVWKVPPNSLEGQKMALQSTLTN